MSGRYMLDVSEYVARGLASRASFWLAKRNRRKHFPQICCFPRDVIGLDIVSHGLYEDLQLRSLFESIFISRLREFSRTTVLDVGANIGNHACWFAGLFSRVIAFEPAPICVHMMKASILMNDLSNIDIAPYALGDEDGKARFGINRHGNLGGSKIISDSLGMGESSVIEVDVRRGDELLRSMLSEGERISMIKMDIEGHEHAALRGLERTILAHKPLVMFESHTAKGVNGSHAILDTLARWGLENVYVFERNVRWMPKLMHHMLNGFALKISKVSRPEDRYHSMIIASADPIF